VTNKSSKESTFDQLMSFRAVVDKKAAALDKAEEKLLEIERRFPDCRNKLFVHGDKTYIVTTSPVSGWNKKVFVEEVEL
jgi:hypothetical protein